MNYKDTEPYMSACLYNWPVNRICGIVFNRFYRLEIHSLIDGIFDPACEQLPPWMKELFLCPVAPLSSLWPPPPAQTKCNAFAASVCRTGGGGGGSELCCRLLCILQEFCTLFLTRFRTYQIASPPQTNWPVKTTLRDWCLKVPSSMKKSIQKLLNLRTIKIGNLK